MAFAALGAIVEGEIEWTVGHVVIQSAALIILFDDVIYRLPA